MNDLWQDLLHQLPPEEKNRAATVRLCKKEQAQADLLLWAAVDQGDPDKIMMAHQAGANLKRSREGQSPVFASLQKGYMNVAQRLVQLGAPIELGASRHGNPWVAILGRDSPHEASQLKDLGALLEWVDATILAEKGAMKILLWWIKEGGQCGIPQVAGGPHTLEERMLISFLIACLQGPGELHDLLNHRWNIQPQGQSFEEKWGPKFIENFWAGVARADDRLAAKKAVRAGWVGHTPGYIGWTLMRHKAWQILDDWSESPLFLPALRLEATRHPKLLFRMVQDLPTYERLKLWAIDPTTPDTQGDTLAHYLFRTTPVPLNLASWWMQNHPQALQHLNEAGHTPVNAPGPYLKTNLETLSKLRARQLHKRFPRPLRLAPVKDRL